MANTSESTDQFARLRALETDVAKVVMTGNLELRVRRPLLWKLLPLILITCSSVVALLLVEGVLRVLGYGAVVHFDYVPEIGWVHEPNQDTRTVGGQPVHINSVGFRGPEFSQLPDTGTRRILLVGDSFTFGYGVADDSTLSVQLNRELFKASGSCARFEVINGGVNGYDTNQEVLFVERYGLPIHPDVVVIGFNPNDIVSASEGHPMLAQQKLREILSRTALYHFLAPRVKSVLFRSRGRATTKVVDDLIAGDSSSNQRMALVRARILSLDSIGQRNGFRTVLAVFPFMEHVYGSALGAWPPRELRTLEQSDSIPVFDPLPALRAVAADSTPLFLDEPTHHPNPSALASISGELARFLITRAVLPSCNVGASVP